MEIIPRRSSVGKSTLLDSAISILKSYFESQGNTEELQTLIINNSLPSELRSIVWRIFLNILPQTSSPYDWVTETEKNRDRYDKDQSNSELSQIKEAISSKTAIKTQELGKIYDIVNTELGILQTNYDFFKSQIVGETLIKLFFVWFLNGNKTEDKELVLKAFDILAGIVYAVFPCIVQSSDNVAIKTNDAATPKALFYYLNSEDSFDADVYSIFVNLLNSKKIKNLIENKTERNEWNTRLQSVLEGNLKELNDEIEKIAYVYLKESNESLLKHLLEKNIDPYISVRELKTSLLTSSIKYDQIIYLWDIVFAYSQKETLSFIDFLSVALVNNTSTELKPDSESSGTVIEFSSKEIVKKALKLRDSLDE